MKKSTKRVLALVAVCLLTAILCAGYTCFAEGEDEVDTAVTVAEEGTVDAAEETDSSPVSSKAIAAAACIAVVAAVGALSMGIAISKATDGISRQPEADGKIRTALMLGLVFIETAVIYALIVAILIIFVL